MIFKPIQGDSAGDFDTCESAKNAEILDVFPFFVLHDCGKRSAEARSPHLSGVALKKKRLKRNNPLSGVIATMEALNHSARAGGERFSPAEGSENGGILYGFPVFGTARMGEKLRCPAADELFRASLYSVDYLFDCFQ